MEDLHREILKGFYSVFKAADEALQQIKDKGYTRPYAADSRPLYRIGVNFSSESGTVEDWKVE